jgi:glutamine synthetase
MMLSAGLDGVKNELTPPASMDINIFAMTAQEKVDAGIASMPASLREALDELKATPLAKSTLGEHIYEKYVFNKAAEWDHYRIAVTDWEVKEYLNIY